MKPQNVPLVVHQRMYARFHYLRKKALANTREPTHEETAWVVQYEHAQHVGDEFLLPARTPGGRRWYGPHVAVATQQHRRLAYSLTFLPRPPDGAREWLEQYYRATKGDSVYPQIPPEACWWHREAKKLL